MMPEQSGIGSSHCDQSGQCQDGKAPQRILSHLEFLPLYETGTV